MAILRSFIFRPESNLPRPDSLPVVPHPDDVFLKDDAILKNVSQPTIWGGTFAIAASLIPNNAVWKPVIRVAKMARFGIARLAESHVPAKTYDPRSETPSVSRIHGND
jgi:hypothetical protein